MTDAVQVLFDNFAANPFSGSRVNNTPQELAAYDLTGNPQPQGWIGEGAIDAIASFAASIRPVILVTALPALPDANYPVGQFVYKTNDVPPRLYKNVADAWVAAVGPNDIQADSITAGQIAAGAISTSELAAGAITAAKIGVGVSFPGRNLVPNGDFETRHSPGGDEISNNTPFTLSVYPVGWTFVPVFTTVPANAAGEVGRWRVRTEAGLYKWGGTGLQHIRPGDTNASDALSNYLPVQGGRRVRFRVWYRGAAANNAGAQINVFTRSYDTAFAHLGALHSSGVITVGTGTTYTVYEAIATLPSNAAYMTIGLRHVGTTGGTTDTVLFDSAELYYVDEDVSHASGDVVIDSTGITINNGKLTLQDEFGATSMVAAGFSGSWQDFIATGLYNGALRAGVAGTVGLGRTVALPYWTVADAAGAPTLTFLNPGVRFTWAAITTTKTIASDLVPVLPGEALEIKIGYTAAWAAGTMRLEVQVTTWDITKTVSTTTTPIDITIAASVAALTLRRADFVVGNDRYFVQVTVRATENGTHSATNKIEVAQVGVIHTPTRFSEVSVGNTMTAGTAVAGNYYLTDGTVNDVQMARPAAKTLTLSDGASGALTAVHLVGATPLVFGADAQLSRTAANVLSLATGDVLAVNNVQVVTSRRTGWAAPTGTATRTTFATSTVTTAQLAERVKALIDDLTTHGLIGA